MAIKDFSQNSPPQQDDNNATTSSLMKAMMAPPDREEVNINDLLINYNEKYKNTRPILFRDKEITQIIATTIGKMKPNSLLIGEAGTGKTKVVQEIARIIASNDGIVPKTLKDFTIYSLKKSLKPSSSLLKTQKTKPSFLLTKFISLWGIRAVILTLHKP